MESYGLVDRFREMATWLQVVVLVAVIGGAIALLAYLVTPEPPGGDGVSAEQRAEWLEECAKGVAALGDIQAQGRSVTAAMDACMRAKAADA